MYATILVALDGSGASVIGGRLALAVARELGATVLTCHAYAAALHADRFQVMEPGLPEQYQDDRTLTDLRDSHGSLIVEGLQALSRGYMDEFLAEAARTGVAAEGLDLQGRAFRALLHVAHERRADLIVLGASGLGAQGDGMLGSTAARVLRQADCDVLVARREAGEGGVTVGIDGSAHAEAAVRKACVWQRVLGGPLRLAAAYDTAFHMHVFETMGRSLSPERQERVGLQKQEGLHRQFIDEGLAALYRGFLDSAAAQAEAAGAEVETVLLDGKAYKALGEEAARSGADLVVVSRRGHHGDEGDPVGSVAEGLVRTTGTNVLVTAPSSISEVHAPAERDAAGALPWDAEALARLARMPAFAQPMARKAIEDHVRAAGGTRVTLQDVSEAGRAVGMGGAPEENDRNA